MLASEVRDHPGVEAVTVQARVAPHLLGRGFQFGKMIHVSLDELGDLLRAEPYPVDGGELARVHRRAARDSAELRAVA